MADSILADGVLTDGILADGVLADGVLADNILTDRILIVEDDLHINGLLCDLLRKNNFLPVAAYSGTEALLLLSRSDFSLVLLDLMLPGKTGEQVLTAIRKGTTAGAATTLPVIVLTARTDKETTVNLLRLGADDYIGKPFDNNELLARIDVQLRHAAPRLRGLDGANLTYKGITLDIDGYDALINHHKAGLSKREYEILRLLMSHPHKVFTKNNLYESVWGGEFLGDDNTVNVHISKLRAKLHALSPHTEYIQTVWGIGFKMRD